jgi:antitoxin ParD1/3/4
MNVALTSHWETFIKQLIESGRYNNASEVVRAGLRQLADVEGEVFPPGSLRHLYTRGENAREGRMARKLRVPKPDEV